MFVGGCSLRVACCVLLDGCCYSCDVCCLMYAARCLLCLVCGLSVAWWLLIGGCFARCLVFVGGIA